MTTQTLDATLDAETLAELNATLEAAAALDNTEIDLKGTGWSMQGGSKNMVRFGKKSLPDRVPAWRVKTGVEQTLPTAQLAYHLAKRYPDGSRVFTLTKPDYEPQYIEGTCTYCLETSGARKKFTSTTQQGVHMRSKHPMEWEIDQEAAKNISLADALRTMSPADVAQLRALLGEGTVNNAQREARGEPTEITCSACGWTKLSDKPEAALAGHRRHCPENEVSHMP